MADFGIVTVYQYHTQASAWRYFYSTSPDIADGWTRDGVAFYAFTEAQPVDLADPSLVEIIRYVAPDPTRYLYLQDPPTNAGEPGPGWTSEGPAFRAFSTEGKANTIPVYRYSAADPTRYRYSTALEAAVGSTTSDGWTNEGEAFWVLSTLEGPQPIPSVT